MIDADISRTLGRMEGQMEGIHREIKEVKQLLKDRDADCSSCRETINSRFDLQERRIDGLADIQTGEEAVSSWWNSSITRIGVLSGVILGIIGFVKGLIF